MSNYIVYLIKILTLIHGVLKTMESIIINLIKQLYTVDILIIIIILSFSSIFLMYFIIFIMKMLTIPNTVQKINHSVSEITARVTKIESDIIELYKTAHSIESLKGALVEIAEINKNTVTGSKQIVEQLTTLNKTLEKLENRCNVNNTNKNS